MSQATVFEWLCGALERTTQLDTLEARGTVRLAIKNAGFEARCITREQLYVVVRRVLANELRARSVEESEEICERLAKGLRELGPSTAPSEESPEAVFRRLGASA